ncbi:hypothetical protein LTR62_002333 [Meristemomyces frigidus]|uniref:Uncharacterized protein n=1 Tax=Meristemomyces frigidus TaxID=1508187 RepID=A0AAN7T7C5_9PEZI|nr:hypothetical protein LTR62_002333 [Meristemomyces frigidus]
MRLIALFSGMLAMATFALAVPGSSPLENASEATLEKRCVGVGEICSIPSDCCTAPLPAVQLWRPTRSYDGVCEERLQLPAINASVVR